MRDCSREVERVAAALRGAGHRRRATGSPSTCRRRPEAISLMLATVADRRDPLGRVRRLRRGRARRPHPSPAARGWSSPPTSPTARATTSPARRSSRRVRGERQRRLVERVVVLRAADAAPELAAARDLDWDDFLAAATGQSSTSRGDGGERARLHPRHVGHDGKPKLAVHTHGGYQVHIVSHGPTGASA